MSEISSSSGSLIPAEEGSLCAFFKQNSRDILPPVLVMKGIGGSWQEVKVRFILVQAEFLCFFRMISKLLEIYRRGWTRLGLVKAELSLNFK